MEDIQCIFCSRDSDQTVIEESGYKGRKCPQCGLIFISPRPTLTEILSLYSHIETNVSTETLMSAAFVKRLYAKHNLKIITKFVKNGAILEIGAGAGYFLDEARKEGFEVYGIEINSIKADFIRRELGIPCVESPLDASLFDEMKFNIIYHCDVISHFYDPISEFRKINGMLKENGIIVFETGNFGDVKQKYYRFVTRFQYPYHLFFFSENNVQELLRRTGFEFIKIYRYSILPQLAISAMLQRVIDITRFKGTTNNITKHSMAGTPSTNVSKTSISSFSFKQLIKNAHGYFFYLVRYRIGYLVPKKGRPQTVIVIARKVRE